MEKVSRFGVSMNSMLLQQFDLYILKKGYVNRSEAIRDIIRENLIAQEWQESDHETIGTIILVYDHDVGDINDRLADYQHNFCDYIISSLHVHMDAHNCLEVLVVKGIASKIQEIANRPNGNIAAFSRNKNSLFENRTGIF